MFSWEKVQHISVVWLCKQQEVILQQKRLTWTWSGHLEFCVGSNTDNLPSKAATLSRRRQQTLKQMVMGMLSSQRFVEPPLVVLWSCSWSPSLNAGRGRSDCQLCSNMSGSAGSLRSEPECETECAQSHMDARCSECSSHFLEMTESWSFSSACWSSVCLHSCSLSGQHGEHLMGRSISLLIGIDPQEAFMKITFLWNRLSLVGCVV